MTTVYERNIIFSKYRFSFKIHKYNAIFKYLLGAKKLNYRVYIKKHIEVYTKGYMKPPPAYSFPNKTIVHKSMYVFLNLIYCESSFIFLHTDIAFTFFSQRKISSICLLQ